MTLKAVSRSVALLVILGILVGLSPGFCVNASGKILTLTSAGTTIILEGNLARARNTAISNGKRNALEAALIEMLPESTFFENYEVINENIYQQPERFIDTYRILSERSRENIYEVTLESTIVVENLRKSLVTLGLLEEDLETEELRFRLKILGVSCSPCFEAVREYLQNELEGVQEVSLYAISPGRFTLDIVYRGDMEAFRYVLLSKEFESFRLDPEEMDEEDLQVLMVLTYTEDG